MTNIIDKSIKWIRVCLSAVHQFPDGSTIRPNGRDFYLYQKPNGYSVEAYVFFTGPGVRFNWVVVKESVKKWSEPNSLEEISENEQRDIIKKLASYKKFKNDRIGLEEFPLSEIRDVNEWLMAVNRSDKGPGSN